MKPFREFLGRHISYLLCGCWIIVDEAGVPILLSKKAPIIKINGQRVNVRRRLLEEDRRIVLAPDDRCIRVFGCIEPMCVNPDHFEPERKKPVKQPPRERSKRWSAERRQRFMERKKVCNQ